MNSKRGTLGRVVTQMVSSLNLKEVLKTITEGLVDEVAAAFARIWLIGPGDLCRECHMLKVCPDQTRCLHLKASSGIYRSLNGEYRRVPLGALKIGIIAQTGKPIYSNDVIADDRLPNKAWIKDNRFRSFAGYPLVFRSELLGVMALFSRRALSAEDFRSLEMFAHQAATAIKNSKLFAEVQGLKDRLLAECSYLQQEIKSRHDHEELIGRSESFRKSLFLVDQVAETDASVLLLGETGTGKELIARAIHSKSPRSQRPLVKVNCASLPAALIESELFGHVKGAFTGASKDRTGRFELADGGTLFLDEIGDLPLELQAKLLRVLQDGSFERLGGTRTRKVDARIIAATNVVLEDAVESGRFRSDLYYRLSVFPIRLPALRDRKDDIIPLAIHFAAKYSDKFRKNIQTISPAMQAALTSYRFPGNIRELENIIERAIIINEGPELHLGEPFLARSTPASVAGVSETLQPKTLQKVEHDHIVHTLQQCRWVIEGKEGAATLLGIHPATLRSRMKKLDIRRPA